jgi:hypothetical protein
MGMRKGKISMKKSSIKNLIKRAEEYSELHKDLRGIDTLIYSVLDNKKVCNILEYNGSIVKNIKDDIRKKAEENIKEKELTNFDFMIVRTEKEEYPIINLDARDIQKTAISYLIVDEENKEKIIGKELKAILYDEEYKELLIIEEKKEISREEIISEFRIAYGRTLIVNSNRKYILVR